MEGPPVVGDHMPSSSARWRREAPPPPGHGAGTKVGCFHRPAAPGRGPELNSTIFAGILLAGGVLPQILPWHDAVGVSLVAAAIPSLVSGPLSDVAHGDESEWH